MPREINSYKCEKYDIFPQSWLKKPFKQNIKYEVSTVLENGLNNILPYQCKGK